MQGHYFYSLLNPLVAFFIAGVFGLLLRRWPSHIHLLPVSLSFVYTGLAFLTQDFHLLTPPGTINFAGNGLFVGAVLLACCGALIRAGLPIPLRTFLLICLGSVAAFSWFVYGDTNIVGRIFVISGAFCALMGVTLVRLVRAGPKGVADQLFLAALILASTLAALRPLLALSGVLDVNAGGNFLESEYWANVQAFTPVTAMMVAALFALGMGTDIARQLRAEADQDYLTGMLNRRGFETTAIDVLEHADHGSTPSLLLADIDNFKQINDRFGHKVGDDVIAAVGNLLAAQGAATLAGRVGGEEFALLFADCGPAQLASHAVQIRKALQQLRIFGLSHGYSVTLSIGMHCRSGTETLDSMLHEADRALYRAKNSGKDRAMATTPAPALALARQIA